MFSFSKSFIKFQLLVLLVAMLISSIGYSQLPCNPPTSYSNIECRSANWEWEKIGISDYQCNMWGARINNQFTNIQSPFRVPNGGKLISIVSSNDYTKANGWVLVKRDFGCEGGTITHPYFILYNKYTGILRLYYFNSANSTAQNFVFTLKRTSSSKNTAFLSGSKNYMLAPDKYSGNNNQDNDLLIYYARNTGDANWIVADFQPTFDPFIQGLDYDQLSLDLEVYAVTQQTLQATINGTAVTEDLAMVGSSSEMKQPNTSNPSTFDFLASKAKQASAFLNSADDAVAKINSQANGMINQLNGASSPFKIELLRKAVQIANLTNEKAEWVKVLGTVKGAVNAISSVFPPLALVGTFMGLISPDPEGNAPPAPVRPTITTYNLKLSGTITTQSPQATFSFKVPGVTGSNYLTYYNCPLGIFNIRNTPLLNKITYNRRVVDRGECGSDFNNPLDYKMYSSYKMNNDLAYSLNTTSNLEVVTVQASLVAEVVTDNLNILEPHDLASACAGFWVRSKMNPVLVELESHRLNLLKYDVNGNKHIVQTPYVDINRLKNMTITVPQEMKVYVRIYAILKKAGNNENNAPIYFIKDFDPISTEVSTDQAQNLGFNNSLVNNSLPPFSNHSIQPNVPFSDFISGTSNTVTNAGQSLFPYNLTVYNTTINTPSNVQCIYRAGNSIKFQPPFKTMPGVNFKATTDYGYTIPAAGPVLRVDFTSSNCYNLSALRVGQEEEENLSTNLNNQNVVLFPNPNSGSFTLNLPDASAKYSVDVTDALGNNVYSEELFQVKTKELTLPNVSSGLYLVRIQGGGESLTKKIQVIK